MAGIDSGSSRSRGRDEEAHSTAASSTSSNAELADLLRTFRRDVSSDIQQSQQKTEANINSHTEKLLVSYDRQNQMRFSSIEGSLKELQQEALRRNDWEAQVQKAVDELRNGLAIAQSATPADTAARAVGLDRDADTTIIRISAAKLVSHDVIRQLLEVLWLEYELPADSWSLSGNSKSISRTFVLQFLGAIGLASQRASKFLGSMRGADGKWAQHVVSAPNGHRIQVYFSPDKGPRQILIERTSKKLFRILEELYSQKKFYHKKKDGVICLEWQPLANVIISLKGNPQIVWQSRPVEAANIDRARVRTEFERSSSTADPDGNCEL